MPARLARLIQGITAASGSTDAASKCSNQNAPGRPQPTSTTPNQEPKDPSATALPPATDQKAEGSSPSERATPSQVRSHFCDVEKPCGCQRAGPLTTSQRF